MYGRYTLNMLSKFNHLDLGNNVIDSHSNLYIENSNLTREANKDFGSS